MSATFDRSERDQTVRVQPDQRRLETEQTLTLCRLTNQSNGIAPSQRQERQPAWGRRQQNGPRSRDRRITGAQVIVEVGISTPKDVPIRWRSKLQWKISICGIANSIALEAQAA
ncbi:hypothetical protein DY000_02010933 [Brassica cretica]|uniref:Uncharacterized protein n=1 Tax=Brassica cretica TaxID=69181 RepID=A0ABQ7D562_BRACR|nr:hypothetical protein DY000_02010933 [Brassica cretica]